MIKQELIETLTQEALTDEFFIVGVTVRASNSIEVIIDGNLNQLISRACFCQKASLSWMLSLNNWLEFIAF